MEPKTTFSDVPKGFAAWFFKQRRRYTSNKKIEWMVERLFQGLLIVWGIILIRWFILITIATLRHFGVFD
ncbi:hypothetical protein SAMN04488688_105254 [Paenibacillus sp. cl141a]|uniref:hypothetical protein n=1 Tax=Paenibacillus sp. cl141a TaxID=1761877 RepID=UPI0008D58316|nr:hypothetical protein [Paenibacillus sp. cl141a]SEL71422.1 hypothetical protein SAMN04488688_105254 [Paenibacillus sp. cl141a]